MAAVPIGTVWSKFHTLAVLYYVCCTKQTVKFLLHKNSSNLNKDIGTHIYLHNLKFRHFYILNFNPITAWLQAKVSAQLFKQSARKNFAQHNCAVLIGQ